MNPVKKKLFVKLINNKAVWTIIKPFAKFGYFVFNNRNKPQPPPNNDSERYNSIFTDKVVLHGPFKGMKYSSMASVGSMLYPKLLGSYERELHGVIDNLIANNYNQILDIGCAEGYYAIGLAIKSPASKIYAYDTDPVGRELCEKMAELNGVADRVIMGETCTADELLHFDFTDSALIVCDCEGYEEYLFNQENVKKLKNCDLLIETHDFVNLNISGTLIELFSATHNIQVIKSIDDIEKAKTYVYDETKHLSLEDKMKLYRECRPAIMEWLYCTKK